jgi:hypothetical protein
MNSNEEIAMASTEIPLYRSVRKDEFGSGVIVEGHAVSGVLYPLMQKKTIIGPDGKERTRDPDVYPYKRDGQLFVDPGGGTSLFDKNKVFGTKHWWYFTLPQGTTVPASLRIRYTGHNDRYDAEHYQIEAATRQMPVDAFKGALDNLARNAVEKLYKDAHS